MTLDQAKAHVVKKIFAEIPADDREDAEAIFILVTTAFDALLDIAASLRKIGERN